MVTTSLGDLIKVKSGDGIAISHLHEYDKYPVYGGNGINGYTTANNVETGTMIIGRVGEKCGNVNITTSKSWVSDNALIVTPKAKYDIEYLKYLLEHTNLNSHANRNAQPVISGQIIYKIEVPYITDTKEQTLVGQMIHQFDTHISNLTELIEKKKGIRDGALEDLVSGRTRLQGVNIIWKKTELDQIASYRKGRTTSAKKHYISTENMRQEFAGITPYSGSYTVDGCEFSEGDTLMANIRPYLKKIWYADFSGSCSADVLVVHCNGGIASKYLYYLVANDRFINYVMNGGTKGIKMPRGDKGFIMHYPVLIPTDVKIQQTISDMLTSMDEEINNLEEEKDKMLQIKAGAMDDLLTGRIRLTRQGG